MEKKEKEWFKRHIENNNEIAIKEMEEKIKDLQLCIKRRKKSIKQFFKNF